MYPITKKILVLTLSLLAVTACKKDETPAEQADYTASVQVTEAENMIQDALYSSDDAFDGNDDGMTGGRTEACATVTYDEPTKTVVVNYGSGCTGVGGKIRSGKITIVFEGTRAVSTKRTMTFENYSVQSGSNSYTLSGVMTSSFAYTAAGYTYNLTAANLNLKLSNNKTFVVNSLSRTVVFAWGSDKKNPAGYTLTINGSSTNTDDQGKPTTVTINPASPVLIKGSCVTAGIYYPASGTYDIQDGKIKYTVSWGSGACDKELQITGLGQTITKILP
jgi:hypothetical protein